MTLLTIVIPDESHGVAMSFNQDARKCLGAEISAEFIRLFIERVDRLLMRNLVADPEPLDWDVLHTRVKDGVVQDLEGGLIVDKHGRREFNVPAEFLKEMLHPFDLCPCMGSSIELGFR